MDTGSTYHIAYDVYKKYNKNWQRKDGLCITSGCQYIHQNHNRTKEIMPYSKVLI
jgi:hypothetical protein